MGVLAQMTRKIGPSNERNRERGFTMAELLIVVAIVAVLVAIAVPVFSTQLKNSRLAVDHAAMRDTYAFVQIANNTREVSIEGETVTFAELDSSPGTEIGAVYLFISKDFSTLLNSTGTLSAPEGAYLFIEDAAVSPCDTCSQWSVHNSWWHAKGNGILVTYYRNKGLTFGT